MNSKLNSYGVNKKTEKINQFSEHGVYVREDDQDWGSAGMNNIEKEVILNKELIQNK